MKVELAKLVRSLTQATLIHRHRKYRLVINYVGRYEHHATMNGQMPKP